MAMWHKSPRAPALKTGMHLNQSDFRDERDALHKRIKKYCAAQEIDRGDDYMIMRAIGEISARCMGSHTPHRRSQSSNR